MPLPKLPLGIQTFQTLREEGMIYIDKTEFIEKLLSSYQRVFLSRPRRFGKSLFLSTLQAYFSGKTALFDGLTVVPRGAEGAFPVIRLDLSSLDTTTRPLESELVELVDACAA